MLDSIISTGATMAGGIASFAGQHQTNAANMEMANNANALSQSNAREQMAFQDRMSSTAHQREVKDLVAAGLNPMLSVSNSGASTPSGSSGSVTTGAPQQNALAHVGQALSTVVPSALQAANLNKDLAAKDASINATNAAALSSAASAKLNNTNAKAIQAGMPSVLNRARSSGARAEADIEDDNLRARKARFDAPLVEADGVTDRVAKGINMVSDAVTAARPLKNFLPQRGPKGRTIYNPKAEKQLPSGPDNYDGPTINYPLN